MNQINYDFIERYQKLYEKDPKSKVFAPLGEAYRKIGLFKEALSVLKRGVRFHPQFASGRVALAKVFMDQKDFASACQELLKATELSPDNLLAQKLLAECYIHLKKTKEALRAYKMVLFLNPHDAQANAHVKKLESLTADEYDDEVFEMRPLLPEIAPHRNSPVDEPPQTISDAFNFSKPSTATQKERQLERYISLTDAFIARLDLERAYETIKEALNHIGSHPEILKRQKFISSRISPQEETISDSVHLKEGENVHQRIDFLNDLLQRIEKRRK